MSYEDRNDYIMEIETYDLNELYYYNQINDYNNNNNNNIEFRDTIINNNEIKDMLDLKGLIDSFNKMHI